MINLSSQVLTPEETHVLSLGLGFCPDSNLDLLETIKDLNVFVKKLNLKALHHKSQGPTSTVNTLTWLTLSECRDLKNLLLTTESHELTDSPSPIIQAFEEAQSLESEPDPQPSDLLKTNLLDLKPKSKTFSPNTINKNAHLFLKKVSSEIEAFPPPPQNVQIILLLLNFKR